MLTDIYARSMMTATRQSCVQVRDLPPAKQHQRPLPTIRVQQNGSSNLRAKPYHLIKWISTKLQVTKQPVRQPLRCIDLQKL